MADQWAQKTIGFGFYKNWGLTKRWGSVIFKSFTTLLNFWLLKKSFDCTFMNYKSIEI